MKARTTNEGRQMRSRIVIGIGLLTLIAAACTPYRFPVGTAPQRYRDDVFSEVTRTNGVTFTRAVNQPNSSSGLQLDIYEPSGDTATLRPAIVWVHGGSFSSLDRTSLELVDEATAFAKKGFVNVSIDYRLSRAGCSASAPAAECVAAIVDAMHDTQAAVRFLRANASTYRIDPTRIAVAGTSAGAITAINVACNPDDPGTSGNPGYSSAVSAAVSLSGAKILGTCERGDAPIFLMHGTTDVLVPYAWAQSTVRAAADAGLTAYLSTWGGEGHVPYVEHRAEIIDTTRNFLWWEMDLKNAAS